MLESLRFYERLGFIELPVNDMRRGPYAVVSDGVFCIGLRGSGLESPALCFVKENVAGLARDLEEMGHEPTFVRTGIDQLHEMGLVDPSGNSLVVQEARSFSAWLDLEHSPKVGRIGGVCLPVRGGEETTRFWQRAGLVLDEDQPDPPVVLRSGALSLVLDGLLQPFAASLDLLVESMEQANAALQALEIETVNTPDGPAVRGPEGTLLRLKPPAE